MESDSEARGRVLDRLCEEMRVAVKDERLDAAASCAEQIKQVISDTPTEVRKNLKHQAGWSASRT